MLNVTSLYFMSKLEFKIRCYIVSLFQPSVCAAGRSCSAGRESPELLHRLRQYLEPKLTQVYKNVSERIGRYVLECKNQVNINMYFHHVQSFQSHYLLLLFSLLSCLSVCSPTSS